MICRGSSKNLKDPNSPEVRCLFCERQAKEVNQTRCKKKYNNSYQDVYIGLTSLLCNVFITIL